MKIIFILMILLSCSHDSNQRATAPSSNPSTPNPQSPYTVEPCYCMKIYMPVCGSDGRTYGNSCEAECQKQTWKDGPCHGQKEP